MLVLRCYRLRGETADGVGGARLGGSAAQWHLNTSSTIPYLYTFSLLRLWVGFSCSGEPAHLRQCLRFSASSRSFRNLPRLWSPFHDWYGTEDFNHLSAPITSGLAPVGPPFCVARDGNYCLRVHSFVSVLSASRDPPNPSSQIGSGVEVNTCVPQTLLYGPFTAIPMFCPSSCANLIYLNGPEAFEPPLVRRIVDSLFFFSALIPDK